MFDAMMDVEMMRIAQEQLKRIPPQELAKIQQQVILMHTHVEIGVGGEQLGRLGRP
ncbi:hypothetical protein QJS04_geneDACA021128 [Acorus gramineus]|uniref:Uncharacterized protein n=1 Tax=Acorus gramineus TaxID=55184 RepID=A0AAV9BLU3_ACOGR|nr:hypothetical protein QJS04_geneDACA021128 [Acorus gramineus]